MLNVTAAGNLGRDAETRDAGQTTVTRWSIAVEQRGRGGEKTTQWLDCSMFGARGEKLKQYLTKGSKVTVAGELSTREHEGKTYLQINVQAVTLQGSKGDAQQSGGQSSGQQSSRNSYADARNGHNETGRSQAPDESNDLDDFIPF